MEPRPLPVVVNYSINFPSLFGNDVGSNTANVISLRDEMLIVI
jgi:hypothetical protein